MIGRCPPPASWSRLRHEQPLDELPAPRPQRPARLRPLPGHHDLRGRLGLGRGQGRGSPRFTTPTARPAATSSTPPTSTPTAPAKNSSASSSPGTARRWCSPPSTPTRRRVFSGKPGTDANAGGNQRKNMVQAVEASLKRLGTDYIDLYWLHIWDTITPAEEVMRAFDDLVRAGKVLYVGISDAPAWVVAKVEHPGRTARLDALRRAPDRVQPPRTHRRARTPAHGARTSR